MHDPAGLLERTRAQWARREEHWVFAYGSLIWRPEFDAAERRDAQVHGWHRALRLRSRVNRGSPERPGLVFALLSGGSCRGVVYRVRREQAPEEFERLWAREMPMAVYDPRWLPCRTPQGLVQALSFTLDRRSEACAPPLADEELLDIMRHARGRCGRSLDYLVETARALREHGLRDREVDRLMRLLQREGLLAAA